MATASLSAHERERRQKLFSAPRTDQSTYLGRVQHFAALCRPWYIFATEEQLCTAQALVEDYCNGKAPASTTEEDVWEARALCDSAVHPDTGEHMNVMGRMCFQPTGSSSLSALLLTVGLKSTSMQLFLQWVNQSYMALLNYSNRNASRDGPELRSRSLQAYVCATAGSFVAAVGFGRMASGSAGLVAKKLVPMAAVAVSTCINVPIMRSGELATGISVSVARGYRWASSTKALIPVYLVTCFSTIALSTPLTCAILPQRLGVPVSWLEPEVQQEIRRVDPTAVYAYINKGL